MKYLRFSVFPAVWYVAVLRFYRRWSRPYAILSDDPGSSGKFFERPFSAAVAFPFLLSAASWRGACRLQTALSGISVQLHIGRSLSDVPAGTALYLLLYKTAGRQIYWRDIGLCNGSVRLSAGDHFPQTSSFFWNWRHGL